MIVLTADRPPELQQTGANQSINQNQLFGSHVRWFFDPGCPGPELPASTLFSCIDQAVHLARYPLPGPVHLNLPFREPFLLPKNLKPKEIIHDPDLQSWKAEKKTWISHPLPKISADAKLLENFAKNLPEQGILSIGRIPPASISTVKKLANDLAWPVFADIASGLRLGSEFPNRVTYYDQLLIDSDFLKSHSPQKVIHLGFAPTSKRWLREMEKLPADTLVWIKEGFSRLDPTNRFRSVFETSVEDFCSELISKLKKRKKSEWTIHWLDQSNKIEKLMEQFVTNHPLFSEMKLVRTLTKIIPESHALFLGNSLPVREVDFYGSGYGSEVKLGLNRGASGIDGLVASSAGYSKGLNQPLTLLLGDLSLLHDLNSLKLISESPKPIVLIVLNNHGGGIFSFLPISEHKDIFETYFSTPHSLEFKDAAKMFKLPYFNPESPEDFESIYLKQASADKSCIIEVNTLKEDNIRVQKEWTEFLHQNR